MAATPEGQQVRLSEDAKRAMAVAIDIMIAVGARWPAIRQELFRQSTLSDAKWTQVPSQSTLENLLLEHFDCDNLTDYAEKRQETVKSQLKGKAVSMALSGNATMLIFCLKNLCNWSDNVQAVPDAEEAKNMVKLAYANQEKGKP